jgi:hypothetical protein
MKEVLLFFSLVATALLAHVTAQTTSTPKPKLGARLVAGNPAAQLATGASSQYTQIDFSWDYMPNMPACGTALTNCYLGFTLIDSTMGIVIATPSTLGPTALSYSYLPPGGVPFGTSVFSLMVNGYDNNGNSLESVPAMVSVVVNITSLNGPTNLMGKTQ